MPHTSCRGPAPGKVTFFLLGVAQKTTLGESCMEPTLHTQLVTPLPAWGKFV